MEKYFLKDKDVVFATGVFLVKDDSVPGGYRVIGFEDDTYFNGNIVEDIETKPYIEPRNHF